MEAGHKIDGTRLKSDDRQSVFKARNEAHNKSDVLDGRRNAKARPAVLPVHTMAVPPGLNEVENVIGLLPVTRR